jgi:hypothetical protein
MITCVFDGAQTEMPVLIANLSKDASQALTLPFSIRCNLDAASKTDGIFMKHARFSTYRCSIINSLFISETPAFLHAASATCMWRRQQHSCSQGMQPDAGPKGSALQFDTEML